MRTEQPDISTPLSREDFKKYGFARTNGKCCVPNCNEQAVDAHHIMDRSLWKNGGYYLSNCAPVCNKHHIDCENGYYTPLELINFCNIKLSEIKNPDKLDWITDEEYLEYFESGLINKWGE
ncbi:MAG: hypothetical protein IKO36_00750 [Bacteroidaceae bacterium]|nr:hypothetical protein [Bacteroidaceae bacterium]